MKNSNKYYDDSAKILGNMILRELAPTLHIPWSVPFQLDDPPIVPTTFGKMQADFTHFLHSLSLLSSTMILIESFHALQDGIALRRCCY